MDEVKPQHIYEKLFSFALVALAILFVLQWRTCNRMHEAELTNTAYEASNDSLHKEVNQKGQEITSTQLILADYNTLKNKLHVSDSTVKKLQQLITKKTISATVLNTNTTDNGTTSTTTIKTEIELRHDTVFVYPTYQSKWSERWSTGTITASKDSVSRSITLYNEYQINQSYERTGKGIGKYFKQRTPMVEVTNINPYTTTTALKSYALAPDKRSKKRAFVAGILLGVAGMMGINQLNK